MNYTDLRRIFLKGFIGFLSLTAILAIMTMLSGNFGPTQGKILLTTLTISSASICALSCAAFIEKRKAAPLGLTGIGLAVVAAGHVLIGIWMEPFSEVYVKWMFSLVIAAVAFAHAFLLVLPDLDRAHRWVQAVSVVSIAVLALEIIIGMIYDIHGSGYFRLIGVTAIVVALETLVVPILLKLKKSQTQQSLAKTRLVLEKVEDNLWRAADGKCYQLQEVAGPCACQ